MLKHKRIQQEHHPMKFKRIVTGIDENGKAVFVHCGEPPRVIHTKTLPGLAVAEMWATEESPELPVRHGDLTLKIKSLLPDVGATRFRVVCFPPPQPKGTKIDPEAFRKEYTSLAPGLGDTMEKDDLAMHTTDTVDYGVVISGRIRLELDDGETVEMEAGDCLVQNGTRHAWRNPYSEPCLVAFIMLGAERKEQP